LVASALLQQLDLDFEFDSWQPPAPLIDKGEVKCVPRNGIGRSCKVGKEQIVGLLLALRKFAGTPDALRRDHWTLIAHSLVDALGAVPSLHARAVPDDEDRGVPRVAVSVPAGVDAQDLANRLRDGSPSVRVDASRARSGMLVLIPTCLRAGDAARIAEAFAKALA
jgi:L-seryl-tRNA(Ser) seleniumtransferase